MDFPWQGAWIPKSNRRLSLKDTRDLAEMALELLRHPLTGKELCDLAPGLDRECSDKRRLAATMFTLAHDFNTRAALAKIVMRKFPDRARWAFWDVFGPPCKEAAA